MGWKEVVRNGKVCFADKEILVTRHDCNCTADVRHKLERFVLNRIEVL